MEWGTILNWLNGGTRTSEQTQTRAQWEEVQALWKRSPLATRDVSFLAIDLLKERVLQSPRSPSLPILVALCQASTTILRQEPVNDVEPVWPVIDTDIAEAVHFRTFLARRRRWSADYDGTFGIARERLFALYDTVYAALPPSCFEDRGDQTSDFDMPLIEALDRPGETIEALTECLYSDETLRREIFVPVRDQIVSNMVAASGFGPDTDLRTVWPRRIHPTDQRGKSPVELADLYLKHTPLRSLLELPVPFHIPKASRFEHAHVLGGTGHGKTQLLQRMIHADLVAAQTEKRSVVVIDSQGDMLDRLMRLDLFSPEHPNSLADRLIVIDPADVAFPPSLNLFDAKLDRLTEYGPADRERVLNGVVELYETFFGEMLGAELTQKQGVVFRYLARLLLSIDGATIHTLMQLMEDGRAFKPQMEQLDGSARHFFETEFFHPSFAATKKQILRRLWGVLSTPAFERMFAQRANKLDLFEAMQDGKIILVSTAKDLLKQEGSALFGRFFIAMLAQATLERSTVLAEERTPTFIYVDEAQEYFDDTVETLLTQGRKFRVGLTMAHQALDQISPRLRAIFHANTALKFAGGLSNKDARAFADELHTTTDFIERMKRGDGRTEFAAWVRHETPHAIRLTVPLGHLERQPTLTDEELDALVARNRARYCGTLADIPAFERPALTQLEAPAERAPGPPPPPDPVPPADQAPSEEPVEIQPTRPAPAPTRTPPEAGKGGRTHRYLQSLVKELGEQQGFRATVEAPLEGGGQVDVLLIQGDVRAAFEVSVSTPAAWESGNLRKCLAAGIEHVVLVLTKSSRSQAHYRAMVLDGLSEAERARVSILSPEQLPDYIADLAPPPASTENVVKGYRVKVSQTVVSAEEAKLRREQLAAVIARSVHRS